MKYNYLLFTFLLNLIMTEKQLLSEQSIIDKLNLHYGLNVVTLTLIPLGADLDASVYKAKAYDQSSYFIKLRRGHNNNIGTIIQLLLHNAGIQHVISPLSTKNNQQTVCLNNFTLIVYPFIQGQDGFSRDLTNDQWMILGKTLRHIHDYQLPPLIKDQVKKESYSPQWRDAVRSIYHYIETEQKITDETALKLLTFMKRHRQRIERLVTRAEQLAQIIQKQSPELVLCHSDIHAGNVLIAEDGTLFIVDWDQPIMAAKERDLMFIGAGVANTWNNPHEEELFYAGYGKTNINKEILAYYRHERVVEDIAVYSQELLLTTKGGTEREVMYKHFTDMFEPRNVIEIAFKTDEDL